MARRSVSIIRKKGGLLGTVTAPDERRALQKAAESFAIPPERQNRLSVIKISDRDDDS
jgi:1,2-phenylacetyl-CoA epoxidase PaaB subunit